MVAPDVLLGRRSDTPQPDAIICVVDASNLERNLYLVAQILELGLPTIVALNMIDVAQGRKIDINVKALSELVGVTIIPTNGKKGIGITELLNAAVSEAERSSPVLARIQYGTEVEEEIEKIEKELISDGIDFGRLSSRWLAVKLLEGDQEITKKIENRSNVQALFKQVDASRKHLTNHSSPNTREPVMKQSR